MIIKSSHHRIINPLILWYSDLIIRIRFKKVVLNGEFPDKKLPVLLVANHISWWDGFWAAYLNKKVFGRKLHFMMLEKQLQKYTLFKYAGGFSVNKNSRNLSESVAYATELLKDPGNVVLLFPQGKIQSMHIKSFKFEKGLEHILKRCRNPLHVIFLVNLTDYFSNPRPVLYMYFSEYSKPAFDIESLGENYKIFYGQCIEKQERISG